MRRISIIKSLAVCAAVALAFPAAAATSASARVSGLTFELIDLDANDGVTASLLWNGVMPLTQVDNAFGQTNQLHTLPGGSVTWSYTFADLASSFGSSDLGFSSSASLPGGTATTSETGALAQVSTVTGGQQLSAFSYLMGEFVLSANTELRVTGLAESSISGSGSATAAVPGGVTSPGGVVFSEASTFLELVLGDQVFNQSLNGLNYAPNGNTSTFSVADYSSSVTSNFSLGWRNTESSEQAAYFSLLAQGSLTQAEQSTGGPAAPVPEPGTWLLMALGLSALGVSARRRQAS